jgi:hypothetical protein
MAHVTGDRVKDTTTTTGTGNITVSGTAPTGFRTLSAVATADGDTLFLAIVGGSEWETSLATRVSANVYTRTTILASSNAGAAVNFAAGTKDVFVTLPASKVSDLNYPEGVYAPRRQQFYVDFALNQFSLANNTALANGHWVLGVFNSIGLARVNAGAGRPALRITKTATNHITNISPNTANIGIQDVDAMSAARLKARIAPRSNASAAPDATDDYLIACGFFDTLSSSPHTASGDCALFAYYQSGGSARLEARTRRAAGSFEVTTLTAPSASTWYTYEVVVTSADVKFYIDGSLVATHTTVPDGDVGDGLRYQSNAGTSSRTTDLLFVASSFEWASDV